MAWPPVGSDYKACEGAPYAKAPGARPGRSAGIAGLVRSRPLLAPFPVVQPVAKEVGSTCGVRGCWATSRGGGLSRGEGVRGDAGEPVRRPGPSGRLGRAGVYGFW